MTTTRNDGQKLAAARKAAGYSLDDVLFEMRSKLPRSMWVSRATLARQEKQETVDAVMVAFLADLYGANLAEFFPEAKEDVRTLSDLLLGLSGWFRDMAAQLATAPTVGRVA